MTPSMAATHAPVTELTGRPEIVGHKLNKDSFKSPVLFHNLHNKPVNCCSTVGPNQRGMHTKFGQTV